MRLFIFVVAVLSAIGQNANAEKDDTGFYIGATFGAASIQEDSVNYQFEGTGNVLGLVSGFHFTEIIGVEGNHFVSYYDDFNTHVISITPKATFHMSDVWSLYGKLGPAVMLLASTKGEEGGYWDNQSGIGYSFGAGINFMVSENTYLKFSYEHVNANLEDEDNNFKNADYQMDYTTLSMFYQF